MKATITIKQYDNGISLEWVDAEGEVDSQSVVALDRDKEQAIGKMILDDVKHLMDSELASIVKMNIEYQPIEED
jgi:hypothetical protein